MSLLDTHIGFVEALRSAGLSVSLAEGLDAIAALRADRLARPRGRAHGVRRNAGQEAAAAGHLRRDLRPLLPRGWSAAASAGEPGAGGGVRDDGAALDTVPRGARRGAGRRATAGRQRLQDLAVEAVARFGAMPGRGSRPVELVGVHRAAAGGCRSELIGPARRRAAGAGMAEEDAQRVGGPPDRRVHRPGRGGRPPPDRRGEGSRSTSPTSSSGPTIDRLDFTSARRSRPRGDAARDLPPRTPARDAADQGAPRPPARPARLPPYGPRLDLHRRGARSRPTTSRSARTAPSSSCCATSAARWPTSRSSRCCSSTRCASSSTGARLHLRRRRARGDPPLHPRAATWSR